MSAHLGPFSSTLKFLDLFHKDPVDSFLEISPVSCHTLLSKLIRFKDASETCPLFLCSNAFSWASFSILIYLCRSVQVKSSPKVAGLLLSRLPPSFSHVVRICRVRGSAGSLATSLLRSSLLLFISESNCCAMERQSPKFLVGKD